MNWMLVHVELELRQLHLDEKGTYYRQLWAEGQAPAPGYGRRVAHWAGERLVRAGERLRAWGAGNPGSAMVEG
jgi:hypothetical protein